MSKGEVVGLAVGGTVNTEYGEDVVFESATSGRKLTVTNSPAVDKEAATESLISIQRVDE